MKKIIYKSDTRGKADYGWLQTRYTFSFSNYYNPERINFGVLRVINDDIIAPGKGFDTHPHNNMEIITIPLSGELEHKDSMGNTSVIKAGEIQVMSAGLGIMHSEFNPSDEVETKLFQIWVFPNKKDVEPRYQQISIGDLRMENQLFQILSPNKDDQGVWIYQNAWIFMGEFSEEQIEVYKLHSKNNGTFIFVIEGKIETADETLEKRDGIGVWEADSLEIKVTNGTKVLIMEVPMGM